jgi:fucose 4-O-acetylase-like acetyltransferase
VSSNLNRVHGLATPVYWLLRRWTGHRLYHLVALVALLLVTLGGLAIPFWWLGERAETVAGLTGFFIVSVIYLYVVALVLAFAAIGVARLTIRRLRSLFPIGKSAQRHQPL